MPTVVVDVTGRGDYDNLATAVRSVSAGTRLLIKPGRYIGDINVDKTLEIIGDGRRDDIVIESSKRTAAVVQWRAKEGRLENLTIRGTAKRGDGLVVIGGGLDIVACDISSEANVGVGVSASTVTLRRCQVRRCKHSGVLVSDHSRGTFEDNDLASNGNSGIQVRSGSDPLVRANRITANTKCGLLVDGDSRGTFEDNDITNNGTSGVQVSLADPIMRGNRINDNTNSGITILLKGQGTYEDNIIANNGRSNKLWGVYVASGAPVVFRRNRLSDNGRPGIRVSAEIGTFENNSGGELVRGV
jgi:parallel beta-helix repeat protein